MNIFVNSQPQSVTSDITVTMLLGSLNLTEKRVAVEVNAALVTRNKWAQHRLCEGDKVEIVTFVGGG